jgi:tRNA threonylcarbamoyladenosine biosynthesis protein TsaB
MILVFDASIEGFAVGVFDNNGIQMHALNNLEPYAHTELLVPTIQQMLSECNVSFQDISQVITTKGPGSFTGIRVGLATAAGLRAALRIPVAIVNTLEALVNSVDKMDGTSAIVHAVLDTKCGDLYHQSFEYENDKWISVSAPESISVQALDETIESGLILTHPSSVAVLGSRTAQVSPLTLGGLFKAFKENPIPSSDLQPLYVRSANISAPKQNVFNSAT